MNNHYPYTNAHELNLDWILMKVKELGIKMDEFVVKNSIIFKGAWNIVDQYPAWSVVVHNNSMYIATQAVPSGVDISNNDYWQLLFNFNSSLATNRKVIMIGDSYGEQNDGSVLRWFWEIFRDALGLTDDVNFWHSFQSGAGFGNGHFLSQLQTIANTIADKDSITDVFVCGGWNDSDVTQPYGPDSVFYPAVQAFDDYVKATFPYANISLAHISWGDPEIFGNGVHDQMPVSIRRYSEQSSKGWRVLAGTEHILHRYDTGIWQSDGAHPANGGQSYLGTYLPSAFLTGSCDINYFGINHTVVATAAATADGFTLKGSPKSIIREHLINGTYVYELFKGTVYLQNSGAFAMNTNNGQLYEYIGTDTEFGKGDARYSLGTQIIRVYADDNKWHNLTAEIYLKNNIISFILMAVEGDGSSPASLNVKYLMFNPMVFTIPFIES